jgi:hypothetical protein
VADIALHLTGLILEGQTELTLDIPDPSSGLFGVSHQKSQETRRLHVSDRVEGRTCFFRLKTEILSSGPLTSLRSILGGSQPDREGYIVFTADGKSGEACDIKDGKPTQFYSITRVA